jgi:hypothetical protein
MTSSTLMNSPPREQTSLGQERLLADMDVLSIV